MDDGQGGHAAGRQGAGERTPSEGGVPSQDAAPSGDAERPEGGEPADGRHDIQGQQGGQEVAIELFRADGDEGHVHGGVG